MADDFKVGDIAFCVEEPDGPVNVFWAPSKGGIYRVVGIGVDEDCMPGIELREDPDCFSDDGIWGAEYFRKLPPADDAFIRKMRALKPVRVLENEDA